MDIIAHFLLTIIIFGWDPFAIIGGILPDILYLLAFIKTKGREFKTTKLFVYGERMHSFFLLPLMGMAIYGILRLSSAIIFTLSVSLHILLDVLTHKTKGPRFLWPLKDYYSPKGLVDWSKIPVMITYYLLIAIFAIIHEFVI